MCINIVMNSDFTKVTSTDDYTLAEVYRMMDEFDWEVMPCGQGYVSISFVEADN